MSKAISVSTGPIFTIFFTKWKIFAWIFLIRSSFSNSSRESAIQYLPYAVKIVKIGIAHLEILWLRANKSATTQNWLSWQRLLRNRKNWTGSRKIMRPSIWWKDCENRSSGYWDSFADSKRIKKNRNVWQSLQYSPLGVIVSAPSEYLWKTLTYFSPECLTPHPLANIDELSMATIIINSGRTVLSPKTPGPLIRISSTFHRMCSRLTSEIKVVIFERICNTSMPDERKSWNFGRVTAQLSFSTPL